MKSDNPSVLNNEVQKHVNEIIKEVYEVEAHSINDFGSDLSGSSTVNGNNFIEDAMTQTELSFRSTINGLEFRDIYLYKNYLKNFKQTSIVKYYKIPLNGSKVIGASVITNISSASEMRGISTLPIPVPDGFDGNNSFVKVMLDDTTTDTLDSSGGTTTHDLFVQILYDLKNDLRNSPNAILYYASDLHSGSFGIEVAKSTSLIQININSTGLKSEYTTEPMLTVKVVYFKRGVK